MTVLAGHSKGGPRPRVEIPAAGEPSIPELGVPRTPIAVAPGYYHETQSAYARARQFVSSDAFQKVKISREDAELILYRLGWMHQHVTSGSLVRDFVQLLPALPYLLAAECKRSSYTKLTEFQKLLSASLSAASHLQGYPGQMALYALCSDSFLAPYTLASQPPFKKMTEREIQMLQAAAISSDIMLAQMETALGFELRAPLLRGQRLPPSYAQDNHGELDFSDIPTLSVERLNRFQAVSYSLECSLLGAGITIIRTMLPELERWLTTLEPKDWPQAIQHYVEGFPETSSQALAAALKFTVLAKTMPAERIPGRYVYGEREWKSRLQRETHESVGRSSLRPEPNPAETGNSCETSAPQLAYNESQYSGPIEFGRPRPFPGVNAELLALPPNWQHKSVPTTEPPQVKTYFSQAAVNILLSRLAAIHSHSEIAWRQGFWEILENVLPHALAVEYGLPNQRTRYILQAFHDALWPIGPFPTTEQHWAKLREASALAVRSPDFGHLEKFLHADWISRLPVDPNVALVVAIEADANLAWTERSLGLALREPFIKGVTSEALEGNPSLDFSDCAGCPPSRYATLRCAGDNDCWGKDFEKPFPDYMRGIPDSEQDNVLDQAVVLRDVNERIILPACGIRPESSYKVLSFVMNCLADSPPKEWPSKMEQCSKETGESMGALAAALRLNYLKTSGEIGEGFHIPRKFWLKGGAAPKPGLSNTHGINPKEAPHVRFVAQVAADYQVTPQLLFFALCSLGLETERAKTYREFQERVIVAQSTSEPKARPPLSPGQVVSRLVEQGVTEKPAFNYDTLFVQRFSDLLKQLCYRAYDGDPKAVLGELSRCQALAETQGDTVSASVVKTLFKDAVPKLVTLFKQMQRVTTPASLRVTLLPEQLEAVVGARFLERPLVILAPGGGKTETGAGYCESVKAKTVLWVTRPGNVYDTAARLRGTILKKSAGTVSEFGAADLQLSTAEFGRLLERSRYLVAGDDTLRHLRKRSPEKFALLKKWVKRGVKVLDECHRLDNPDSGRSQTIQDLPSKASIGSTATPFQYRSPRVATLLHLTLPRLYPDSHRLAAELNKDPQRARDLLRAHATIYGITDLADYFSDPKTESFASQLRHGRPKIPKLAVERVPYTLSLEHSRFYVDLATNFEAFAGRHGLKVSPLQQGIALRRLLRNPELLGASPPFALINKIKELSVPDLEESEKVLTLGYGRHPLQLLAEDPEMQQHGIELANGDTGCAARAEVLKRLEDDPSCKIVAGQINAVGSGHNCRSVSRVIVIDRPPLTSELKQGLGRPQRLIFQGDERFAREKVIVTFLEPKLHPDVLEEVTDPVRLQVLRRGTVYESWLNRDLAALQNYEFFTARGRNSPHQPLQSSVAQLIEELAASLQELRKASKTKLLSGGTSPLGPYNNPVKNAWRHEVLDRFVTKEFDKLNRPLPERRVAHLAGPEALEIPVYLAKGIKPENIFAFESEGGTRREICRQTVDRYGCRFIGSRVQDVLPRIATDFDIISIDPDGYLTPSLFSMFLHLRLSPTCLVMKNCLAEREQGEAQRLLELAGGDRRALDAALIKLCGTAGAHPHNFENPHEALLLASAVRAVAAELAPLASKASGKDIDTWGECLEELYLGSRHVKAYDQISYVSGGGSAFLSTLARLEAWDAEVRDGEAGRTLRAIMQPMIEGQLAGEQASIKSSAVRFKLIPPGGLLELYRYFTSAVSEPYRHQALARIEQVKLKVAVA